MRTLIVYAALLLPAALLAQNSGFVQGKVVERMENGEARPVIGAAVYWLGQGVGTMADTSGRFRLAFIPGGGRLVVSSVGYRADTLDVKEARVLRVFLAEEASEVATVDVVGQRTPSFLDYRATTKTIVMTEKELFKAACCNLSESFETNPSVDVSFTDAVTGTRQIEMLGLAGTYSQITVENMPAVRGLTSNIGLTYIPGAWIENIQVSKGVGSVANGYESMTGQINVEYRKPWNPSEQRLYVTMFGTDEQRFEGSLNYRQAFGEHLSSFTLLNMDTRLLAMDVNGDRFLDAPVGRAAHVLQRFSLHDYEGIEGQVLVQYTSDQKRGGTKQGYSLGPDALTASPLEYAYRMDGEQLRISGKLGYLVPGSNRSVGLQWAYADYRQDSRLSLREYAGRQQSGYLNLLYDAELEPLHHRLRGGVSFLYDHFDERFVAQRFGRTEQVPGVFLEYTWSPDETVSIVAGLRADRHNIFGTFVTPRLHARYTPEPDWVLRLSAGRGQRTANVFAENVAYFASARAPVVEGMTASSPYRAERSWNVGFSATRYISWDGREGTITVDLHRTWFDDQLVVNLDRDPGLVVFQPLAGSSFSNSLQAELNMSPLEDLELRTAYRFLDVQQSIDGSLRPRPFVARHRAFVNLAYTLGNPAVQEGRMSFDATVSWFGSKRLPATSSNPGQYQRTSSSPSFFLVNGQVTRGLIAGLDLYVGVENLLGFRQDDPILSAADPSTQYFDSSLIWGPLTGRMVYGGLRWRM